MQRIKNSRRGCEGPNMIDSRGHSFGSRGNARLRKFRSSKWTSSLMVVLILVATGCTEDPTVEPSCADGGADCTLRQVGTEAGLFLGSTSEAAEWTAEPVGELVRTHFNSVTSQNELKWGSLVREQGVYDFAHADETVAFAEKHGLRMRGHVLFWHRLNALPAWFAGEIEGAENAEERLRELMGEHAETVVGRYKGRIQAWDVVNEPLAVFSDQVDSQSIFFKTFASYDEFLDLAFKLAREADPEAKLFINEIFPGFNETTFNGLYRIVKGMVERGTPLDGVGFQGHFVLGLPDREILTERLQAFADLGLLVEITELDISINLFGDGPNRLSEQAEAYRDVYAACTAVSTCIGVTTWNSNDGQTWLDADANFGGQAPHKPTLFDDGFSPKPAYYAVRDQVASSIR